MATCRALFLATFALCNFTAQAAMCTDEQLAFANTTTKEPCAASVALEADTSIVMSRANRQKAICLDTKCIDAWKYVVNHHPDCSVILSSYDAKDYYRTRLASLRSDCNDVGVDIGELNATPPPTNVKPTSSFRPVSGIAGSGSGSLDKATVGSVSSPPPTRPPYTFPPYTFPPYTYSPYTYAPYTPPPFRYHYAPAFEPTVTIKHHPEGVQARHVIRGMLITFGCLASLFIWRWRHDARKERMERELAAREAAVREEVAVATEFTAVASPSKPQLPTSVQVN